jgi:hypothetical protein
VGTSWSRMITCFAGHRALPPIMDMASVYAWRPHQQPKAAYEPGLAASHLLVSSADAEDLAGASTAGS